MVRHIIALKFACLQFAIQQLLAETSCERFRLTQSNAWSQHWGNQDCSFETQSTSAVGRPRPVLSCPASCQDSMDKLMSDPCFLSAYAAATDFGVPQGQKHSDRGSIDQNAAECGLTNPHEGCYRWSPAGWSNPPDVTLGCAANAGVLTWSYPANQLNVTFELQPGQRCVSVDIDNGPSGSLTLKDLQDHPFGFVAHPDQGHRTWVINTTTPSSPLALVLHAGSNAYHEELSYNIKSIPCADEARTITTAAKSTSVTHVDSTPATNVDSTPANNVGSTPVNNVDSTPAIESIPATNAAPISAVTAGNAVVESHALLLTIGLMTFAVVSI